ncbi:MAG: hypothetical protein C0454_02740 [Parvibaculum sp.]|nr:hypothetical protein [Parvibaculum sp.]
MILLTDAHRARLLANGRRHGQDYVPVAKLFNPLGEVVWLASELNAGGDLLYGLADFGEIEMGSFRPSISPPPAWALRRARPSDASAFASPARIVARTRQPATVRRGGYGESERGAGDFVTGWRPRESLSAARRGVSDNGQSRQENRLL